MKILTPEEGKEYRRLYEEHERATIHAANMLRAYGMESNEFRAADAETCRLWKSLRELQGMAGQHWTA